MKSSISASVCDVARVEIEFGYSFFLTEKKTEALSSMVVCATSLLLGLTDYGVVVSGRVSAPCV